MAKVFLDTNIVIDIAYRKPTIRGLLSGHEAHISPLSIHILCYLNKIKVPNQALEDFVKELIIVDFNIKILKKAIIGPTNDFEDNIQLQSALKATCDYFLTNDEKLLKMKVAGKTKIVNSLAQ